MEKLTTHGGSIRVFATHAENDSVGLSTSVASLLDEERVFGLFDMDVYKDFQEKANRVKNDLLAFLLQAKQEGKRVIAYGAAAKGNTLLNYAGVKSDMIDFVVDKSPHKQGKFLPGSHVPIVDESEIVRARPDYVLILPWNIRDEVMEQLGYVREWDCKFVVAVPGLEMT